MAHRAGKLIIRIGFSSIFFATAISIVKQQTRVINLELQTKNGGGGKFEVTYVDPNPQPPKPPSDFTRCNLVLSSPNLHEKKVDLVMTIEYIDVKILETNDQIAEDLEKILIDFKGFPEISYLTVGTAVKVARAIQTFSEPETTESLLKKDIALHTSILRDLKIEKLEELILLKTMSLQNAAEVASTTYTIKIFNYTDENQGMYIFSSPPVVGQASKVYSNSIYAKNVKPSGQVSNPAIWKTTVQYYAMAQSRDADKVPEPGESSGSESSYVPISLYSSGNTENTSCKMEYDADADNFGLVDLGSHCKKDGSFQITTSPTYTNTPNTDTTRFFNIGLGIKSDNNVILAGFVNGAPGKTYVFTPITKFYVACGDFVPGQVVDVTSTSTKQAEVDFTGKSLTTCEVTYTAKGEWETKFVKG